jgi:hypothetical protein
MRVEEGTGTALGKVTALASTRVTQTARFADGQWQLLLTRALASADTTQAPSFTTGHAIPVAFYVADGSTVRTTFADR